MKSIARLALTEISTNVAPARKSNLLKALKRGVTRSMDLQDTSIPQLEFGAFQRQQWDFAKETHNSMQGIFYPHKLEHIDEEYVSGFSFTNDGANDRLEV